MLKFNHAKFFEGFKPFYKRHTGKTLDATKIKALDFLLTEFESTPDWKLTNQIAYALATIHIETFWPASGKRYEPIAEGGGKAYFIKRYWTKKSVRDDLGNKSEYDAWARSGRGYVQLTGLANDTKMSKLLGIDLIGNPSLAMDPHTAFRIMTVGMFNGVFTGKKLGTYVNANKSKYIKARGVINGIDRAAEIASYAVEIEHILNLSLISAKSLTSSPKSAIIEDTGEASVTKQTEVTNTSEGATSSSIETTNEQDVTQPVEVRERQPYNGIGFWKTIRTDLAAVTGGNLTFEGLSTYFEKSTGWPEWVVAVLVKLSIVVIVCSALYLIFRVIHFLVFEYRETSRIKIEADNSSDITKRDIKWIPFI